MKTTESLVAEAARLEEDAKARVEELLVRIQAMAKILSARKQKLFRASLLGHVLVIKGVAQVYSDGRVMDGLFGVTDRGVLSEVNNHLESLLDEVS